MVRLSNNLLGILNIITLLLSIPIIGGGIWLSKQGTTECERFLDKPVIALGVFVLLVSIAGLVGSCCRVTWLLWIYLLVMFLLIVLLFCFTVFAFVVTNKGAGEALSGKGYKEYRLGRYSNWLERTVNKDWSRISSCLRDSKICQKLQDSSVPASSFFQEHLSSVQSGCCKPSNDCNFEYVSPTNWRNTGNQTNSTNPDCGKWSNDPSALCYSCDACKAGLLDNMKSDWRRVAVVNIVFLVFLIIVYSVGCCAFRNNREDNAWKPYP